MIHPAAPAPVPSVRPAAPGDVSTILALIGELAEFERAEPGTVRASEQDLRTALFGPDPAVWAHVAEVDGAVVGLAMWYVTFSTWTGRHGMHLEDFVVTGSARGSGAGAALFDRLVAICRERGYPRLEWRVLDWNVDAQGFYAHRGAAALPEWISWRLQP